MAAPFATALSLGSNLFSGISGYKGGRTAANIPIGIGPTFSRISGAAAMAEARAQSELQLKQANIAYEEGLRAEALRRAEIESFKEGQAASFASGGITLAGSPLGVLEETQQLGDQELRAMRSATEARSNLITQDALRILRNGGTQQFAANVEAQMSEFDFANKQRLLASQSRNAGIQGLLSGGALGYLGARSAYPKIKQFFNPPKNQYP